MSLLFPVLTPAPPTTPRTFDELIDQRKWWKGADGWIKVKKMTPAHRANAARLLMRNAARVEFQYGMSRLTIYAGAPDEVLDEFFDADERRADDPAKWLRGTKLYRSLMRDVHPIDAATDDAR